MTIKHAESVQNAEYTLCGIAFDCDEPGDDLEGPVIFAGFGDEITCSSCLDTINYCLTGFSTSGKRAWVKKP